MIFCPCLRLLCVLRGVRCCAEQVQRLAVYGFSVSQYQVTVEGHLGQPFAQDTGMSKASTGLHIDQCLPCFAHYRDGPHFQNPEQPYMVVRACYLEVGVFQCRTLNASSKDVGVM